MALSFISVFVNDKPHLPLYSRLEKKPLRDFHVFPSISLLSLSLLLHHTIPAGANLRLAVYRCIIRLNLSNPRPASHPSPREGAADQEKGEEWRKE